MSGSRVPRMTVRIELPQAGSRWPAPVRVYRVNADSSETELKGVRNVDIRIRPDEVIMASVELDAYVAAPMVRSIIAESEVTLTGSAASLGDRFWQWLAGVARWRS